MAAMAAAAAAGKALSRVVRTLSSSGGYSRMLSGKSDGADKGPSHTEKWMAKVRFSFLSAMLDEG
jgi:hypothetical protein